MRGAVAEARRLGLDVVLSVELDPDDCGAWVRHALARGTDGLVSVVAVPDAEARAALATAGVPLVVVDPRRRPPEDVLSVGAANFQGALEATAHLLALGHRRIATITGVPEQDNALARLAGYRAALIQADVPVDDDLVRLSTYGVAAGYEETQRLLALDDPRRRSSRAATTPRSVRCGRSARRGGPCRTTSRSSGSTTCPSRPGPTPAHHGAPAARRDGRLGRRARAPGAHRERPHAAHRARDEPRRARVDRRAARLTRAARRSAAVRGGQPQETPA